MHIPRWIGILQLGEGPRIRPSPLRMPGCSQKAAKTSAARKGTKMEFFLDIKPPTVTAQEHKVTVRKGKPMFYDTQKLKQARFLFESLLRRHSPDSPFDGPVALSVDWWFATKTHKEGAYRITRPDTDNLQKLLKDTMTSSGFWHDDAQVSDEHVTKRWSRAKPGIHIKVVCIHDP